MHGKKELQITFRICTIYKAAAINKDLVDFAYADLISNFKFRGCLRPKLSQKSIIR